ncbi:MAG: hypothetical protein U0572_13145 [Phycisphaerales bacterium]
MRILSFASATEALMGLCLLAVPSGVAKLLFAAELPGAGAAVARVAGIALISLGFACWHARSHRGAGLGMLVYS